MAKMKDFRVYHWDTFDEPGDDTSFLDSFDTEQEAVDYVKRKYTGFISGDGADQVHIVDKTGRVVKRYYVNGGP